MMKKHCL